MFVPLQKLPALQRVQDDCNSTPVKEPGGQGKGSFDPAGQR